MDAKEIVCNLRMMTDDLGRIGVEPLYLAAAMVAADLIDHMARLLTADEFDLRTLRSRWSIEDASKWLADRFREKPEWPSDEIRAAADTAGIDGDALFEASDRLPIRKFRAMAADGSTFWVWKSSKSAWPGEAAPASEE